VSEADERRQAIPFSLEGERLEGQAGDTLAAALLRNGVTTFTRSIKYHRPRGPFCLAGSCGQCLVRVDGVPSLPACQVDLKAGMVCERQNGPLGLVDSDLFRAVDFIYPGGLDHHHLMIQSRLLGRVALEVARRLAGLGTLPDRIAAPGAGSALSRFFMGRPRRRRAPRPRCRARRAGAQLRADPETPDRALGGRGPSSARKDEEPYRCVWRRGLTKSMRRPSAAGRREGFWDLL